MQDLHPHAKRALLLAWGDWGDEPTAAAVRRAMALGHIDYYVLKPWKSPDELFHRTMGEFLHEWARADRAAPQEVTVVADPWSPRGHELRDLLARNGVPHAFHPTDSPEGQRVLGDSGRPVGEEGGISGRRGLRRDPAGPPTPHDGTASDRGGTWPGLRLPV